MLRHTSAQFCTIQDDNFIYKKGFSKFVSVMVEQITRGIKISVKSKFEGSFLRTYRLCFAFAYTIIIENQSNDSVQLVSRHWEIADALSPQEIIDGEGVVGKKPVLKSGESFTYTSGCLLSSPIGAMRGYFGMVSFTTTKKFRVYIPSFKLAAPFTLN